MDHLNYLVWILAFLVIPMAILWLVFYKELKKYYSIFVINGILMTGGLVWDNWGSAKNVWSFPSGTNLGYNFGKLPFEEYLAFGLLFTIFVTSLTIVIKVCVERRR
ncbi:MAG: lycopene cyclase domain-containing protein [bacterium]|nr:lycopene cyclase domain-containing protein [bacterium]